jgi:hypothetical protein
VVPAGTTRDYVTTEIRKFVYTMHRLDPSGDLAPQVEHVETLGACGGQAGHG